MFRLSCHLGGATTPLSLPMHSKEDIPYGDGIQFGSCQKRCL